MCPSAVSPCSQVRLVRSQDFRAQVAKLAAYYQRHRRRLLLLVWRDASVPHFNTATGACCASVYKLGRVEPKCTGSQHNEHKPACSMRDLRGTACVSAQPTR